MSFLIGTNNFGDKLLENIIVNNENIQDWAKYFGNQISKHKKLIVFTTSNKLNTT